MSFKPKGNVLVLSINSDTSFLMHVLIDIHNQPQMME